MIFSVIFFRFSAVFHKNRHWTPYYILCQPCFVNYNLVTKLETIDQDIKYLFKTLDLSSLGDFPEGYKTNKASKKLNNNQYLEKLVGYYAEIPSSLIKKLYDIYRECYSNIH